MRKRKKLSITLTIIFLLIVALGASKVTYAFITEQTEKVNNNFEPNKYTNVEIIEPNGPNYIINSDGTLDKNKSASFDNPDNLTKAEYMRAKVIPILRNADGSNVSSMPNISIQYTEDENWVKEGDYYYYTKVVLPGESSTELFTDIKINDETLSNMEEGQYIEISVLVDTIERPESDINKKPEDTKVFEAWGVFPENLNKK